jgi:hypothetical protein
LAVFAIDGIEGDPPLPHLPYDDDAFALHIEVRFRPILRMHQLTLYSPALMELHSVKPSVGKW